MTIPNIGSLDPVPYGVSLKITDEIPGFSNHSQPIQSMYGIFTYIWLICMVNVGKYTSPMDAMAKGIFQIVPF